MSVVNSQIDPPLPCYECHSCGWHTPDEDALRLVDCCDALYCQSCASAVEETIKPCATCDIRMCEKCMQAHDCDSQQFGVRSVTPNDHPRQLDLEAIEARCNAAGRGPWILGDKYGIKVKQRELLDDHGFLVCSYLPASERASVRTKANMTFIAAARTDIPALVAECRELRKRVEYLGTLRDHYDDMEED